MCEHQEMDLMRAQHEARLTCLPTIHLGQHVLEFLEDGGLLLIGNTTGKEVVQLDSEESYRLLVTLQATFQMASESERSDEARQWRLHTRATERKEE